MSTLRFRTIRLAHMLPKGSTSRKALLQLLARGKDYWWISRNDPIMQYSEFLKIPREQRENDWEANGGRKNELALYGLAMSDRDYKAEYRRLSNLQKSRPQAAKFKPSGWDESQESKQQAFQKYWAAETLHLREMGTGSGYDQHYQDEDYSDARREFGLR